MDPEASVAPPTYRQAYENERSEVQEVRNPNVTTESKNERTDSIWQELVCATTIVDYVATVRRLTNYEVWESVQLALFPCGAGLQSEEDEWRNLRILLDELSWRHSGLEGSSSGANTLSGTA